MRLETERLILRPWQASDRAPYARFNADPQVRRFYPSTLTPAQSDALVDGMVAGLERDGYGFLAVERKSDGAFVGDVGVARLDFHVPGDPRNEIGWLLGREFWGFGYAPEAARACLDHAFTVLGLPEVVAFTYRGNLPSQRVMEKIGMTRDPTADFDHPKAPEGSPVRPHVLYRIVNPGR